MAVIRLAEIPCLLEVVGLSGNPGERADGVAAGLVL